MSLLQLEVHVCSLFMYGAMQNYALPHGALSEEQEFTACGLRTTTWSSSEEQEIPACGLQTTDYHMDLQRGTRVPWERWRMTKMRRIVILSVLLNLRFLFMLQFAPRSKRLYL